jgi:hypothetical protein
LYGNLIFDNGWEGPDRGHGHSIYVQNASGTKRIADNVLFNSFSYGIHGYTEGGFIDNIHIEGNVAFGHGRPSRLSGPKANILVGGLRVAANPGVVRNYTYYPVGNSGRNAELGYSAGCDNAVVRDNYFVGGVPMALVRCTIVAMTGNLFVGPTSEQVMGTFPENRFFRTWPGQAPDVFVTRNRYEKGRGWIVIYNWGRQAQVTVDPAPIGFRRNEAFVVRDVQNYFGPPVVRAQYTGGTVQIPMSNLPSARPSGDVPLVVPHTGPDFAVFEIERDGVPTRRSGEP